MTKKCTVYGIETSPRLLEICTFLIEYYLALQGACKDLLCIKGIVHFEINFWYVLAYLKGIQDVGVFVSAVV